MLCERSPRNDKHASDNLDGEGTLRNTISIAARLGGQKSVWCCLFPECSKALADSINSLCQDFVCFWSKNLFPSWKRMSQLDKRPQQIRFCFFSTLSLFISLLINSSSSTAALTFFPYSLVIPVGTFIWISDFFVNPADSLGRWNHVYKRTWQITGNKKSQSQLFVSMS